MNPPIAAEQNHVLSLHGHDRIDPYYWMRDKKNAEVIDYLNAENAYTKQLMKHTADFQKNLYTEMRGRIKEDDSSVPVKRDNYYYYTRQEDGKEYPIYCRKANSLDDEEEVLLNVNELAEGHKYYQIRAYTISHEHNILAYGVDLTGNRKIDIYFKDLKTGNLLPDKLMQVAYATWASDNQTIFYMAYDDAMRSHKIFRHRLGDPVENAVEVFHEKDEKFDCYISRTSSKKYMVIHSQSTLTSEAWYIDAFEPTNPPTLIQARQLKHEFNVDHYQDRFYFRTNWEAQNFRLMSAPVETPSLKNWEEVIPHRTDVLFESMTFFKQFLVLEERSNGLSQIRIKTWDGPTDYYLPFNDPAYVAYVGANYEFDTSILRYHYTSMTTPNSVYDFNMETQEQTLRKQTEVLGGFASENYVSERLTATARDGQQVPISLVYKKDTPINKNTPLLLYAYGSYGINIDPHFSSIRLSLLDRGFVFAIAHIRGSETLGRAWYDNGKFLKKKNTFTDFIDCAEHLLAQNYTSKDKLVIQGGSAGGLLMGAVINLRPDLFKGVLAQVPFVDVITTMLDTSLPLTTGEYEEWGNPNDKEYYDYMLSYSPYDNVVAKDYPNMLVTTGINDSQVHYWEPTKWVAKLRKLKTDNNKLLLHINMDAGHGGASGRFESLKEIALNYAFILDLFDIKS